MLGLVYLTGVAGLIASSAVLHQMSQSRCGHLMTPPLIEIGHTHRLSAADTSRLNEKEDLPSARKLHRCVLTNESLSSLVDPLDGGQSHCSLPLVSQTSLLCFWSSLLASVGGTPPQTECERVRSPPSSYLASPPSLQCKHRNTSTPGRPPHLAPTLTPSLYGGLEPSLNSCRHVFSPLRLGLCRPEALLLMPG